MIQKNYNEELSGMNRELEKLVSNSGIAWSRKKEEIWVDLEAKIDKEGTRNKNFRINPLKLTRYAAAAAIILLVGYVGAMNIYTKKIESLSGEEKEILLPDQSSVRLYSESTLSYKPLKWMFARKVRLEGEGFFNVHPGKSFEVISQKAKVAVLGTQFLVHSREDKYHVSCKSGLVEVTEVAHKNKVRIAASQKAILKPDGKFKVEYTEEPGLKLQNSIKEQVLDEEIGNILSGGMELSKRKENEVQAGERGTVSEKNIENNQQDKTEAVSKMPERNTADDMEPVQESQQIKAEVTTQNGNRNQEQNPKIEQGQGDRQPSSAQDKFRESLTPEQISILENKQMSREEIREAFRKSLSSEQIELLQEQNAERNRQNQENVNDAQPGQDPMEQQRMQQREQSQENAGNQNREMLRNQLRENNGDLKSDSKGQQGGGNGPGR